MICNIKKINIKVLLIFLVASCTFFPPQNSTTNYKLYKKNQKAENKGSCVTAIGEMKALFLFVKFKDDKLKSDSWKAESSTLPEWAKRMVNNNTAISFPYENLTQYYYEMSNGNLFLYGDVYPKLIIPQHSQNEYKSIADVNSEILKNLDKEIDFSKYDNWSKDKSGKYVNKPDGKVDVIFIVYRNFINKLFFNNGWTGIAHLYLEKDIKTNDGVTIKTGRLDAGSGIEVRGAKNGFTYIKYVLAHEFGHLLFGAGHIENSTNLALMTGGPVWNASRGMNSWERAHLNWMNFTDVDLNKNSEIWLDDYFTKNSALRIKLSKDEWFTIENHQKISKNDWAGGKGIYIYKINRAENYTPVFKVECADGNWNFKIDEENKKAIRTVPNPNGKSEMEYSQYFKGKSYTCSQETYEDNSAWGDQFDSYDLTYNNLFSPLSNPSSKNNNKKDFAIQVVKKDGNKYLLKILFKNIFKETPPSKPQIMEITEEKKQLNLSWLSNQEPDLAGYNLYEINSTNNKLNKVVQLGIENNSKTENYNLTKYVNKNSSRKIFCITAFDKDKKESVHSNFVEVKYNSSSKKWDWKIKEEI